jgi:hypothetical protein
MGWEEENEATANLNHLLETYPPKATRRAADRLIRWLPAVLVLVSIQAQAGQLATVETVLAQAFPGCDLQRETLFLTEEQLLRVAELSGINGQKALVTRHVAHRDGAVAGFAYLDTHRVRTLPETILIAVSADGVILRVEAVAFREPPEYLPPQRWYDQLDDHGLSDELALKRGIRPITGATLTARATVDAVRRVLAVHITVSEASGESDKEPS